ncbi:MAG: hypothetical protein LIQ31_16210, partial [Planctomycetes bacterium]|nr:hypothetical protein [Planctomycetota bacterium]
GDAGPAQLFELIRPENGAVRNGRVAASCSCIPLKPLSTSAAPGEPLYLELRTINPTPEGGRVYDIYVEVLESVQKVLRQFALVVSD